MGAQGRDGNFPRCLEAPDPTPAVLVTLSRGGSPGYNTGAPHTRWPSVGLAQRPAHPGRSVSPGPTEDQCEQQAVKLSQFASRSPPLTPEVGEERGERPSGVLATPGRARLQQPPLRLPTIPEMTGGVRGQARAEMTAQLNDGEYINGLCVEAHRLVYAEPG